MARTGHRTGENHLFIIEGVFLIEAGRISLIILGELVRGVLVGAVTQTVERFVGATLECTVAVMVFLYKLVNRADLGHFAQTKHQLGRHQRVSSGAMVAVGGNAEVVAQRFKAVAVESRQHIAGEGATANEAELRQR